MTIQRPERVDAGVQLWMIFPFWGESPEFDALFLLLLWGTFSRDFGSRKLYLGAITLVKTYCTIYFFIGRWEGVDAGALLWMMLPFWEASYYLIFLITYHILSFKLVTIKISKNKDMLTSQERNIITG